jgi:hypothetical protein
MIKLSDAAYEIDGQPMFKVLDKVQKLEREGKKILHFELGEPDFDTVGKFNHNLSYKLLYLFSNKIQLFYAQCRVNT